jgi:cell division GTPase FtsZ
MATKAEKDLKKMTALRNKTRNKLFELSEKTRILVEIINNSDSTFDDVLDAAYVVEESLGEEGEW